MRSGQKVWKQKPRQASSDFLIGLDNALRVGLDRRLSSFHVEPKKLEQTQSEEDLAEAAPLLVLSMDQGSPQYAGYWYLAYQAGVNVVSNFDPFAHRPWNDVKGALKEAQLMRVLLSTMVLYNYRCGPWQSSGWFRELQEAVKDAQATLTPQDPLVLRLWPGICKDKSWSEIWEVDGKARADYLQTIHDTRDIRTKGEQVTLSRWFSWQHEEYRSRSDWFTKALVLTYYNIVCGNVTHCSELQLSRGIMAALTTSACSSSKAPQSTDNPDGKEAEAQKATRQKFSKTMHVACAIAWDPETRSLSRIIGAITNPIAREHGVAMKKLRGVQACKEAYVALANYEWLPVLGQVIERK